MNYRSSEVDRGAVFFFMTGADNTMIFTLFQGKETYAATLFPCYWYLVRYVKRKPIQHSLYCPSESQPFSLQFAVFPSSRCEQLTNTVGHECMFYCECSNASFKLLIFLMRTVFPDWFCWLHDSAAWESCKALFTMCLKKKKCGSSPFQYVAQTVGWGPHTALFTVSSPPPIHFPFFIPNLSPAAVASYVKSFETASMKLGADMRMVKVQMMEKREKATRHSRSTTAAANFHSLQIASAWSWSRNRWAMYDTSSKMRWISGGGMLMPIPPPPPIPRPPTLPTPPGGSASSLGVPWARPPSATPESLEGGQCELSMGW